MGVGCRLRLAPRCRLTASNWPSSRHAISAAETDVPSPIRRSPPCSTPPPSTSPRAELCPPSPPRTKPPGTRASARRKAWRCAPGWCWRPSRGRCAKPARRSRSTRCGSSWRIGRGRAMSQMCGRRLRWRGWRAGCGRGRGLATATQTDRAKSN